MPDYKASLHKVETIFFDITNNNNNNTVHIGPCVGKTRECNTQQNLMNDKER